jgi:hypothetical protein
LDAEHGRDVKTDRFERETFVHDQVREQEVVTVQGVADVDSSDVRTELAFLGRTDPVLGGDMRLEVRKAELPSTCSWWRAGRSRASSGSW